MVLSLAALLALLSGCSSEPQPEREGWRVYALEYGRSTGFKRKALVQGGEGKQDAAWTVWVVRDGDQVVLVDTGFDDQALAEKWRIHDRRTSVEALAELDIAPADVDHVVLTHLHWDHAGLVSPWTQATFWVQQDELEWAESKVSEEKPMRAGLRLSDVRQVRSLVDTGRARLVQSEAQVLPGISLHPATGHTEAIQWVEVSTQQGTVVLASDNAYLYENLEQHVPIGSTRSAEASAAVLDAMLSAATKPEWVVPGHDPLVFERNTPVSKRVVEVP